MAAKKNKKVIYISSPLFTLGERMANRIISEHLSERLEGVEIILPQDFRIDGKFNDPKDYNKLFKSCLKAIDKSDIVIAVLDGADSDSGTAFEIGYAYAKKIPVIGVRTDYREGQEKGANLMLAESCTSIVREYSFTENTDQLCGSIVRRIKKVIKKKK
ncbi:MAG: nucleoside 2-deoxyribosyltransferase [Planctomycetota bacterium]|jgi:nucleoside 2-deoxyribosyltransferase